MGQFIDHDLTFDPVASFGQQDDPDARTNFRTPRFDLDSVYGRGPSDQPYMYRDGNRFLYGREIKSGSIVTYDLPRTTVFNQQGDVEKEKGRAIIGDPRNDENRPISQLHSSFLRFHNRMADEVERETRKAGFELFLETQRRVRWHYQYIVLHNFLPKIVNEKVIQDILVNRETRLGARSGRQLEAKTLYYRPKKLPYMPVEFSVDAYRFGHSMVRPSYHFNDGIRRKGQVLFLLETLAGRLCVETRTTGLTR